MHDMVGVSGRDPTVDLPQILVKDLARLLAKADAFRDPAHSFAFALHVFKEVDESRKSIPERADFFKEQRHLAPLAQALPAKFPDSRQVDHV